MDVYELKQTYPFDAGGAVVVSVIVAGLFVGAVAVRSRADGSEVFWDDLMVYAALSICLFYLAPRMVAWMLVVADQVADAAAKLGAITPDVVKTKHLVDLEKARLDTLIQIRNLGDQHLQYAMQLIDLSELITIDGHRVTWNVEGQAIPVSFALEWWEAYQARPEGQLPGQTDWDGTGDRQVKRRYSAAITTALWRLGAVQQAVSQYPPRWLTNDERQRTRALQMIGFETAYDVALYLAERESENGKD